MIALGHANPASPRRSARRRRRCCTCPTSSPTRWRSRRRWSQPTCSREATGQRRPGRSSATPAPRPTRRASSWPASSAAEAATSSSAPYGSFHGRTLATLAATGQPAKHEPFHPMPDGFRHVACGDVDALDERRRRRRSARSSSSRIQGEGGVIPAPPGYLRRSARSATSGALLMIVDEIQTGFARTGRWFGFQHDEIVPDVVTMAKAMGNGMPVGAVLGAHRRRRGVRARRPRQHVQRHCYRHGSGRQRRDHRDAPDRRPGAGGREGCAPARPASEAYPASSAVRGQGLLLAAELDRSTTRRRCTAQLLDDGLVTNAVTPTALRFAPPLTVSRRGDRRGRRDARHGRCR